MQSFGWIRLVCIVGICFAGQMSSNHLVSLSAKVDEPPPVGLVREKPAKGFFVETDLGYMVPYTATVPGSSITYEMVPIPGGRFKMGSPASEKGRSENEGPQIEVEVPPFWMGKHEVTWGEYKVFMGLYDPLKDIQALRNQINDAEVENKVANLATLKKLVLSDIVDADAITVPTPLYEPEITFELGEEPRQPAATMSPYGAKQYTKWLSLAYGYDLRLPSEAEWEYASRAGTETAYFFGDEPNQLGEYAWYYDNSDETTHLVGQKKPSPWGLFDIYGNVAEWTLDETSDSGYSHLDNDKVHSVGDAIRWPTAVYPRTARGGHYDESAENCRSAAKIASDISWTEADPNLPKSPWWLTDYPANGVGFRLLRPLKPLTAEDRKRFWEAGVDDLKMDIQIRLEEGRGVRENAGKDLQQAIKEVDDLQ